MNIEGLDKAMVLAALYNRSKQQGMGVYDTRGRFTLGYDEAKLLLQKQVYFDYLYGHVLKIDLSKDDVNTALYNRDNGEDAAEEIIEVLKTYVKLGKENQNDK